LIERGLKRSVLIDWMPWNGGGGAEGGVAKLLPRPSLKSLSWIFDDAALPGEQGGTIDEIDSVHRPRTGTDGNRKARDRKIFCLGTEDGAEFKTWLASWNCWADVRRPHIDGQSTLIAINRGSRACRG
jgi:hypothetical protein